MAFGQSIRFAKSFVEVGLDATEAQKSLRKFRNQFRSIRRVGIGVGAGITAAMTPVVALFTKATIAAAEFEETISRFNQEFGRLAPQMRRFTDDLVNGLGQSRQQVTEMMAGFNTLVRRGGAENAARLSQTLTSLTVDLGSFFNRRTVDVQRDLMSMLAGSSEVMEKYGVNVKVAALNQELLNNEIDPKQATEYQKILARINITMRETAQAQGDAARTQGSLTNQYRAAQNQIQNSMLEIGNELLPSITTALQGFNAALRSSKNLLADFAATSGQIARQASGKSDVSIFGLNEEAKLERGLAARRQFGALGRAGSFFLPGFGLGTGAMSTEMINRRLAQIRRGRGSRNRNPARASEMQGGGSGGDAAGGAAGAGVADMMAATVQGQGALGVFGRMFETARFRGRSTLRGMIRQFGPGVTDAQRAIKAQIKGMQAIRDEQKKLPVSSHEIFSQSAFGGDFVALPNQRKVMQDDSRRTAEATEAILEYIKNNSVVFG